MIKSDFFDGERIILMKTATALLAEEMVLLKSANFLPDLLLLLSNTYSKRLLE